MRKGKWFEEYVNSRLREIGIVGVCSRTALGTGRNAFSIGAGEIDYLGWSENDAALVLLECKMIHGGAEPRSWKNQLNAFLYGVGDKEAFISKCG